jgi:hypothetical protein
MIRRFLLAVISCVVLAALVGGLWAESAARSEGVQIAAGRYHAKGRTQSFYKRVG